MTFKLLQLSPQTSTRALRMRAIPERWISGYAYPEDMGFLRSWMEDDSCESADGTRSINWGAISGLVLSLAISGGFWAGVGFLIAHFVK